jgi:cystathionine gamma-synthase
VHAGRVREPGGPLAPSLVSTSAFHAGGAREYARDGNPTWEAFEEAVGELEGGAAVAFGSGMAAAAAVIEGLPPTAHVVIARTAYIEARHLLAERSTAGRLVVTEVDPLDLEAVRAALGDADALWVDAISNPNLDVARVDLLSDAAHAAGAVVVVDATLATPLLVRPIERGADLVLHSATKLIGGHSDLLLGTAIASDRERAERLRDSRSTLGSVPGAIETWLALRGMRTLALRLRRAEHTASLLAERLHSHPGVRAVRYPGLPGDPSHEAAKALLDGFGAVVAFEVAGGSEHADVVCERVRLITHATSVGGVESLIDRPSRWHRERAIPAATLRLSVGCEHPDDLWADLDGAIGAG